MKIPFPAGKYIGVLDRMSLCDREVQKMMNRKNICISFEKGWLAFDRGFVLAAFYEDSSETLAGFDAFVKLVGLRDRMKVYEIDRSLLSVLLSAYPEVSIGRRFQDIHLDAKALDISDTLIGSRFFEEQTVEKESLEEPGVEENVLEAPSSQESAEEEAASWIVDLESYICSLEGYSGVVEASDGNTSFRFWLKNGKVVAAVMDDGGNLVKGNAVLYFANITAQIRLKDWTEPPRDALCIESETGLKALFESIDREAR
jgi:hypothetical protein